ncbi:MAG: pyruvate formate lyase family protein, partial [Chloroflexota bacterium]
MATKVNMKMLEQIDKLQIGERPTRLKKFFYETSLGLGSERITAIMDIWDKVQNESLEMQRAKFLEAIVNKVPAVIWKDQSLVGGCKYFRGCYPCLDYDSKYLSKVIEGSCLTFGGPIEKGGISKEDLPKIAKAIEFFQGKAVGDKIRKAVDDVVGADWYDAFLQAGNRHSTESMPIGPNVNDNEKLLKVGLKGIIKECQEHIEAWKKEQDFDTEKLDFWRAAILSCEATIALSKKYGAEARRMAKAETAPDTKARLLKVAETCEWVPENPARSFQEALQSIIMVHLAILLHEGNSCNTGWGRIDDYLYPYFKKDIAEKNITLQNALD